MAQKWAEGGKGKAKTSTGYVKGYAGGGFIEGLASGISAGYGSGSRKADANANKSTAPSKLAIKFDDGTTIADNVKSGFNKLKNSLSAAPADPAKPEGTS